MRAAVLHGVGQRFEIRDDVEYDDLRRDEVQVRLAASGVCHTDLSFRDGALSQPFPCVLGHEAAGVVTEIGTAVTRVGVGDHVVISWIPSCGRCARCVGGQPHLCIPSRNRRGAPAPDRLRCGTGPLHAGMGTATLADETIVPEQGAVPVPTTLPLDLAALLGCGVLTGVGAVINTAKIAPGDSIAVVGCGGVGLNVVQGARIAGASIIVAVDPVTSKRSLAVELGATHAVSPSELTDAKDELTNGHGFDYVFEAVGRSDTIRVAWDAARVGGTAIVVGAGRSDDHVTFNSLELFATEKLLKGSLYGSSDPWRDVPRLVSLWEAGRLELERLVSDRIEIEQIDTAFDALADSQSTRTIIDLR